MDHQDDDDALLQAWADFGHKIWGLWPVWVPLTVTLIVVPVVVYVLYSFKTNYVVVFGMPKAGTTSLVRRLMGLPPFDADSKKKNL
ncbi:hypothetical protein HK101_006409, partial [Irineochytrium annulatum]